MVPEMGEYAPQGDLRKGLLCARALHLYALALPVPARVVCLTFGRNAQVR